MCYQLRQIHQCPHEDTPGAVEQHIVYSFIRCSSPKPCRGMGFGRLTKKYRGPTDYCQRCLGSVVAARAPLPGMAAIQRVSARFEMNPDAQEFVDNILSYVDALYELALLAMHERLPRVVLDHHDLYPIHRLMTTLLWETMCARCNIQLQCFCRPGRNENSWNVARHARTVLAKDLLQRFNKHTSPEARARHAVDVANRVHAAITHAVAQMNGDGHPVLYDVEPVHFVVADMRFTEVAHDLCDPYRPPPPPEQQEDERIAQDDAAAHAKWVDLYELYTRFDVCEFAACLVAHDSGVPDDVVKLLGSRFVDVLRVRRADLLAAGHVALADEVVHHGPSGINILVPPAPVLQDGVFLPALWDMVRLEAVCIAHMYRRRPSDGGGIMRATPPSPPVRADKNLVDGRFRGGFETLLRELAGELTREHTSMDTYEQNRAAYWRRLLADVARGVEFVQTDQIPRDHHHHQEEEEPSNGDGAASTTTTAQCFIHLSAFREDVPMEEPRLSVNGGKLEPQPMHRHWPIRLRTCVRTENAHAFCMVGLAEWSFVRREVGDGKVHVVDLRPRRCNQCFQEI